MIRPREEPDRDEFLAEINRKLAADSRRHNLTPDPGMGGLSPEQVARLIYLKWDADQFPMRMGEDLPMDSCERSRLFSNCRTLLLAIHEAGGVKITSGGNLIRAFVAEMIETLDVNREVIDWITKYKKTINEEDAWDTPSVRQELSILACCFMAGVRSRGERAKRGTNEYMGAAMSTLSSVQPSVQSEHDREFRGFVARKGRRLTCSYCGGGFNIDSYDALLSARYVQLHSGGGFTSCLGPFCCPMCYDAFMQGRLRHCIQCGKRIEKGQFCSLRCSIDYCQD